MRNKRIVAASAMMAAVGLSVAACGSSHSGSGGSSGSSGGGYDAALTSVVNPSTSTTGNVVLEDSSALQSADPGDTYDATDWNVSRLWARTMLAFANEPGKGSQTLVGDLATGPGQHNAANTQWTYTLNSGATFSNGDPVTPEDIAYAISRSGGWGKVLTGGPTYFSAYVANTNSKAGTLETSPSEAASTIASGITYTSNTITFNLNQPVSDFDDVMTLPGTAPFDIQAGPDAGLAYANHVISSGAYEIQSYTAGSSMVLVPNTKFNAASDPNKLHPVHASMITLKLKVAQDTIDQDILHGRAQADIGGVGVDSSDQGIVLSNPTNKALADDAVDGFENYLSLNTQVAPLDNLDCRQAVEYAINKTQVQDVMGGTVGAGQIATTIIPPTVQGYVQTDVYQTPGEAGDIAKAKTLLATCKSQEQAKGTWNPVVNVSAFTDQPKVVDGSDAIAQELNAVGFTSSVKGFEFSNWGSTIGSFNWEKTNRVLVANAAWGPDFPDGNGYLTAMVGAAGVNMSGNASNYAYWSDPTFGNYLTEALKSSDVTQREADWAAADKYAMQQAVIVPLQYATALDIRAKNATNVYFEDAYGMYNYAAIGVSQ
jgi:peptide/nickel transport system substrate-binding protein